MDLDDAWPALDHAYHRPSGRPLVTNGPYRVLSHPNYLVVVGEIAVLPLCLGLPWLALIFSAANAILLSIRIRAETIALTGPAHVERA